ncbi:MAG: DNA topology modulation protein FlaR [Clostridia bacterium]|nr:DNA topology modulation protein FlaR [Clostridia bacterium]
MKIYIVGSVASGKSTLARQISGKTGVKCYHLDDVVYIKDKSSAEGNKKRSPEERDAIFQKILSTDFIIEDTGRACFVEGLARADKIVVLDIPYRTRAYRIVRRHVRQVLGIEKATYRPSMNMVRMMFKWAKNFDTGEDGVKARVEPFSEKMITLRSAKAVERFLDDI